MLFYPFPVLLTPMQEEFDAGPGAITGALTAAVLATAAVAVPVGHWLDRHGGRALMVCGSVAASALVYLWSTVDSLLGLYAVWIGIGLCSAGVLYEAAFAVIVPWFEAPGRSTALLAVTVVAGFASTIFFPLTGWLAEAYGWRQAVVVLAVVHAAITVPLHAVVRRAPSSTPRGTKLAERPKVLRDRAFWLIATAFVLNAAAISAGTVHLVSYLRELGHPATFAATVAGLLGVLSVTGRVVTTGAQRRFDTATVAAAMFVVSAAGVALLPFAGPFTGGAIAAVVAFGVGVGVSTIARPALLADRYGVARFATISGLLVVPMALTKATAPLGASLLREATGTYTAMAYAVAAACVLSAAALLALAKEGPPVNTSR